jgi:hypothetical protein
VLSHAGSPTWAGRTLLPRAPSSELRESKGDPLVRIEGGSAGEFGSTLVARASEGAARQHDETADKQRFLEVELAGLEPATSWVG